MTRSRSFKSVLAVGGSMLALLSFAPASFAGEDDDDEAPAPVQTQPAPAQSGGGGGGGDTGSASGGVQTGFGGMSTDDPSFMIPLGLAGGGILVLSAAGALSRRRALEL